MDGIQSVDHLVEALLQAVEKCHYKKQNRDKDDDRDHILDSVWLLLLWVVDEGSLALTGTPGHWALDTEGLQEHKQLSIVRT